MHMRGRSRRLCTSHCTSHRWHAAIVGAIVIIGIAACSEVPDPQPALANASDLIAQAETNGATDLAAADLSRARELLHRAQSAEHLGRNGRAARLAREAAVEARLAIARTAAAHAYDEFDTGPAPKPVAEAQPATRQ